MSEHEIDIGATIRSDYEPLEDGMERYVYRSRIENTIKSRMIMFAISGATTTGEMLTQMYS